MKFADFIRKEREKEVSKDEYRWGATIETRMGQYRTKIESRFIDQCLRKNPLIHDILDVGGGNGRFALPLHERGFNAVVLENNLVPLRKLNNKKKEIDTILADGAQLPVGDCTFDCILSIGVFGYFLPVPFDECYRVLRKNGILIFTIQNPKSWVLVLQRYLEKHGYGQYSWSPYMPTLTDAKTQLLERGFKIEYARGYRWIPAGGVSNNKFIPLFAFLEWFFCLRFLKILSPEILIMGRKVK